MNNINDLEYRLWLLQGEVNQAIQNAGRPDYADLERLNHMEAEICYLQQQVAGLKVLKQEMQQPGQAMPPQQYGWPQPPVQPLPLRNGQPLPTGYPLPMPQGQVLPSGTSKKKDLEKTLGTGIMGIVASVLVFISIIIFGGLLLSYLTDAVMTAIMFLLSFLLLGTGCFLLRKNPKNKFNLSLCACGATAVCVSLFVTRLYFALIHDGMFLGLIAVWLALTVWLCIKYKNYIFQIIGELGVFLTMCLGTVRLAAADMVAGSWFMFCALLFVFGCSTFLFNHFIPKSSYEKNGFSHVIRTFVWILLFIVFSGKRDPGIGVYVGFAAVSVFWLFEIYMSYKEILENGCLFYGLTGFNALMYCAVLCRVFGQESFLPYYVAAILLAGFFEVKKSKYGVFGNIVACLIFLGSGWGWLHGSIFYAVLVMLPLFAYGYAKKNTAAVYIGLFCIIGIFRTDMTVPAFLLLWAVPFLCFTILARRLKEKMLAAVGYPVFMACGAGVFGELFQQFDVPAGERVILVFLVLAVMHILIVKCRAFEEDGREFEVAAGAISVCLMLYGAYAVYQEYLNGFTMLVMAVLFFHEYGKSAEKIGELRLLCGL